MLGAPRKETVRSLFQALERYREVLAADAAAFYGRKARELSPDVSAEPRPAPAGALTAEDMAELAPVLERQVGGGAPWLERHPLAFRFAAPRFRDLPSRLGKRRPPAS